MSTETQTPEHDEHNLEFLMDVPLRLSAELGSCKMTMEEKWKNTPLQKRKLLLLKIA